jgi:peptidoglycan/xylan/chitin deacetylase (PgdA/CDA1 family)
MTTTSKSLGAIAMRAQAPLAKLEEKLFGLRPFERIDMPPVSALTVTCDDGEIADLGVVDALTEAGVRGVFAVSPDLIGRPGFLTYAQLRQIRDTGHEIAFHGTTHDPFTRFQSTNHLRAAVADGMNRLATEGFDVSTLIYPYGANNRWVRSAVAPTFDCAFSTWHGLNKSTTNRYSIRRIPFGSYTGRLPATERWYCDRIEQAAVDPCWLALMLHPGADSHTTEHNSLLGRLVRHAAEMGVPVRTAKEYLGRSTSIERGYAQASHQAQ